VSPAGARPLTRGQYLRLVFILGFLHTLGTLTIDIYLPAFPAISRDFAATQAAVQFTFTGAMVGMMVGQLCIGVWSDRVGRRLPLVLAAIVHVLASLMCAASSTVEMLIAARFLQGAASAATVVVTIAIVRDLFHGRGMLRLLANLALIYGMAIVVGPFLGSQLLRVMDWRGVFVTLALYACAVGLLAAFGLKESLPRAQRRKAGLGPLLVGYRTVFGDHRFVGLAIAGGLTWAGMYAYLSSSSFLFQEVIGLTGVQYGLAFASHAVFMLGGTQVASLLIRWWDASRILEAAMLVLVLAPASLLAIEPLGWGLWGVLPSLWLFTLALGMAKPCVQSLAMSRVTGHAGIASSLLGGINTGLGAIATPIAGAIGIASVVPVGATMLVFELSAAVVLWLVVRPGSLRAGAPALA
jgi:DHA1 family bicyclomycin/chloramphenicol resistance-like MFS transporter